MQWLDAKVRDYVQREATLAAEGASLLREVEDTRLWHWLGYPSIVAYVEARFGIGPHAALERLRTARELADLPQINDALAAGTIKYGHARELSRMATRETESDWLAHTDKMTVGQVQREVAGLAKGDLPDAPKRPELERVRVYFDVTPAVKARIRDMRALADTERGERQDDSDFLEMILRDFAEREGRTDVSGTRPAYQVATTICRVCKTATQTGAGIEVVVPQGTAELACCDAEHIGDVDADEPARVKKTVTDRMTRQVRARDGEQCVVPGCRAARNLDNHHIIFQSHGGPHKLWNLATVCSGHHRAVHDGKLSITGRAPDLTFVWHREQCDRDLTEDESCRCPVVHVRPPGDFARDGAAVGRNANVRARTPNVDATDAAQAPRRPPEPADN
jgi:hypothetical protein